VNEQAKAAVRVSGAHHSSWKGQQVASAPDRKVRGSVTWNNTIEYNDEKVTAPLKEMFANARVHNQDQENAAVVPGYNKLNAYIDDLGLEEVAPGYSLGAGESVVPGVRARGSDLRQLDRQAK
jgi:hypothetical protein